jgi:hypothetical protein
MKNTTMPKNINSIAKKQGSKKGADREYAVRRTSQVVVATAATDIGRSGNFIQLNNVPDVGDFTALFDQFTIDRLDLHFVLTRSALSAGNSGIFPTLLWAPDYNDSSAPTLVGDVLSYDGMQMHQFSESSRHVCFSIKPKAQLSVSSGTAVSTAGTWLSTSGSGASPWFGYKYWLVDYNSTSTTGSVVTLYTKYHLRFKVPK